jgi:hypothetical protein
MVMNFRVMLGTWSTSSAQRRVCSRIDILSQALDAYTVSQIESVSPLHHECADREPLRWHTR